MTDGKESAVLSVASGIAQIQPHLLTMLSVVCMSTHYSYSRRHAILYITLPLPTRCRACRYSCHETRVASTAHIYIRTKRSEARTMMRNASRAYCHSDHYEILPQISVKGRQGCNEKICSPSCTILQHLESRRNDETKCVDISSTPTPRYQRRKTTRCPPSGQPIQPPLSNPHPSFSSLEPQNGSAIPSVLSSPLPCKILATVAFFLSSPSAHLFNCHIFASILSLNLSLGL